ncbi:MAG: peptidylprolyl isomerase [Pyrinomonadaceae bacterium]
MKDESAIESDMSMSYNRPTKIMRAVVLLVCALAFTSSAFAQDAASTESKDAPPAKKSNARPGATAQKAEPFDKASVEKMASQCVKLETEAGVIEMEMLPEAAPESVRNFLNLAATGALDTTTFSRVVKDFVIQGGNLSTSEKWSQALLLRASRTIPDEPNYVKHVRGIVSMARPDTPNGASTHFFILVSEAAQLDGKFAAFGRVTTGMDVVDKINQSPVEGDKPDKPVRITRAIVAQCAK